MYNAFLERTQDAISALRRHIHASDRFRTAVFGRTLRCEAASPCFDRELSSIEAAPNTTEWRIIDHCAAVTRIYSIYEQFAHEMIREHLSLLQRRLAFDELPEKIRLSYRGGIAKILEKIGGPRYAAIDVTQLIAGYHDALSGNSYIIEPQAMLMQEQNLRLPELDRFMRACGIDDVSLWIETHPAVEAFFATGGTLNGTPATEMAALIDYRNDAAHGSIDVGDILHINVLTEFCDFVGAVCAALAERVQLAGLRSLEPHGHVVAHGKIIQSLKDGAVAIGQISGAVEVGSTVYLCGQNYCFERTVTSLQIEGKQLENIDLPMPTEVGIMFNGTFKKNGKILTLKPLARPLSESSASSGEDGSD
jgi:hypothetical protein